MLEAAYRFATMNFGPKSAEKSLHWLHISLLMSGVMLMLFKSILALDLYALHG